MNNEFQLLKAGSERLNEMMKDIHFCLSTVRWIMSRACFGMEIVKNKTVRKPMGSLRVTIAADLEYFVKVFSFSGIPQILIYAGEDNSLDTRKQLDFSEIKLLHKSLDVVIEAGREFCQKVGTGTNFDRIMKEITGTEVK